MQNLLCAVALVVVAPMMSAAEIDAAAAGSRAWRMAPALKATNAQGVRGSSPNVIGIVYDSFTGAATLTTTTGSPRTFMGAAYTTAGSGSTLTVTAARVYLASTAAQTYANGLLIQVQFWDSFNFTTNPIFATPVGAVQQFTVAGPVTLALNTFTPIDLTFATPLVLTGVTHGIGINYQGDNGGGPVSVDTLTSLIRGNGALAVGTIPTSGTYAAPQWGFFRNAAGQTTFNFAPTDLRTFAGINDLTLALQLTGEVTPVELQSFQVE